MSFDTLARRMADSFDFFVRDILKANPSDDQQKFINAVQKAVDKEDKQSISIRSGHGTGKTAALAWLILWIGLTRKDAKLPTTAPVAAQLLNILIPEVRKWANKLPQEMKSFVEVQSQDVRFFNGNHCFARTARKENTEALAGVHAGFVCYIVDEASGIDQKVFDVIEGALTGENFIFIMTSNPTRTVGTFYDSHNSKRKHYQTLHFDSELSSNVNIKWVKDMEEKYGRDSDVFNVRVKGNFPKSNTGGLFEMHKLEEAMKKVFDVEMESGVKVIGLDVARYGDDSTILCKRYGLVVRPLEKREKKSTTEIASWSASIYNQENMDVVIPDTIGVGAGVYDQLCNVGVTCIDGNSSLTPDDSIYLNKRAEMYFNLKKAIDNGLQLPYDEELLEELLAITYSYTERGKIKLISKQELKEILGRSPDKSDAVALTFFTTIIPKSFETNDEWVGGY